MNFVWKQKRDLWQNFSDLWGARRRKSLRAWNWSSSGSLWSNFTVKAETAGHTSTGCLCCGDSFTPVTGRIGFIRKPTWTVGRKQEVSISVTSDGQAAGPCSEVLSVRWPLTSAQQTLLWMSLLFVESDVVSLWRNHTSLIHVFILKSWMIRKLRVRPSVTLNLSVCPKGRQQPLCCGYWVKPNDGNIKPHYTRVCVCVCVGGGIGGAWRH